MCTVSPGYAWEIQTPEGGWGMEGLLRSRAYALNGVLNGIDDEEWNPQSDPHIEMQYSGSTFSRGKAANKAALQRELGLPERPDVCASLQCSQHAALLWIGDHRSLPAKMMQIQLCAISGRGSAQQAASNVQQCCPGCLSCPCACV